MEISTQFLILVPVVISLVQVFKLSGFPSQFAPLISLLLGVAVVFIVDGAPVSTLILQGILVGLTSSGLFSGVKSTLGN
jgi:hypothetical protein